MAADLSKDAAAQNANEPDADGAEAEPYPRPWPALWALCLGFFMILVDSTIVSVAMPSIMADLHVGVNAALWVTSAYLLAYAVPLLITGRLGDRYGPKNLYLIGLVLFTASSAWCGFTRDISGLVTARVFQGLGAAMMTPQTMSVITRIFPKTHRGQAMGMWGAVAGVAALVGPILGGVLVQFGWEWIFFVNVPIGVIGFVLAWVLVPTLPTKSHRFDLIGVGLSGLGMFLVVFGIQQGQAYNWSPEIWAMIIAGALVMVVFVLWQRRIKNEPLVPLTLFKDRNFSVANAAISTVGFTVTAMAFPIFLYAQLVLGLTAIRSALLLVPMAVIAAFLAPMVGKLADKYHPRNVSAVGLVSFVVALFWLSEVMKPNAAIWTLLLPIALLGVGNGFVWSPLSSTATRNLPMSQAGAGSGVYNTTRQTGSVLGSAGIAVLMDSRLLAHGLPVSAVESRALPPQFQDGFAAAMSQSLLLPAGVILLGLLAVQFFQLPSHMGRIRAAATEPLPVPTA